jgi:hypothetical protein
LPAGDGCRFPIGIYVGSSSSESSEERRTVSTKIARQYFTYHNVVGWSTTKLGGGNNSGETFEKGSVLSQGQAAGPASGFKSQLPPPGRFSFDIKRAGLRLDFKRNYQGKHFPET